MGRLWPVNKKNNVVLIGGQKSEPWDYLFDGQLNFVTDYDYDSAKPLQIVRNRNSKPGEQPAYSVQGTSGELIGYATIAYLPNPSHTSNVIILAGTDFRRHRRGSGVPDIPE